MRGGGPLGGSPRGGFASTVRRDCAPCVGCSAGGRYVKLVQRASGNGMGEGLAVNPEVVLKK